MTERDTGKNPTFHALKARLGAEVKPLLHDIGFQPFKSKSKFPERYYRQREGACDVIEFQFDKYARPAFRIHFRPIEDPQDLEVIDRDKEEMWVWNNGYGASPNGTPYAWFKVHFLERLFRWTSGIERVAQNTRAVVGEIDAFLLGGPPSRRIFEERGWDDPITSKFGRRAPARRISR